MDVFKELERIKELSYDIRGDWSDPRWELEKINEQVDKITKYLKENQ